MATNEDVNEKLDSNFVIIKSEPTQCVVDVKTEPPDPEEQSTEIENINIDITLESEHPNFENITVKIEPTCYSSSDDELDLASYQNLMAQESYEARQTRNKNLSLQMSKLKKRRKSIEGDEDYRPPKKKKKVPKEIVKKTYSTKAKKPENRYSENVTQRIELVTISEEERQIEFKELWQSRKHMRYTCGDCAIGFLMEEPYVVHMKTHEPEAGAFVCDICRCRSRTEEQLYKHRLRHYRRYRCSICSRVHKDKETAASHVMSEHVHEAFTCDQCGKGFKRPAYLKKHVAQQHTRGTRHECPICARVFFHSSMFKTHFRRHNEEVRNPIKQLFICDICCQQLHSKAALRRHLAVHARAGKLACAVCAAEFQTRRGLKQHHVNKHTERKDCGVERRGDALAAPARAGKLACAVCAAEFQTRGGLKLHHLNKHTEKKERLLQQCPQCERECTTPALLRQHIRRMHTDRTKKYQCDHCKRFYYTKGELRAHIVWSHAASRGDRALFCCGREFRTRTRLKDHVAIHHLKVERERIHKCDQCDKAFANKQVLNRHRKSHSAALYPCPAGCGAAFKCEAYIKVHYQLKHLNMTRAEIAALRHARRQLMETQRADETLELDEKLKQKLDDTLKLDKLLKPKLGHLKTTEFMNNDEPQDLSMRSEKEICFEKVIVKQEVDYSDCDISVPLFDFADLKGS